MAKGDRVISNPYGPHHVVDDYLFVFHPDNTIEINPSLSGDEAAKQFIAALKTSNAEARTHVGLPICKQEDSTLWLGYMIWWLGLVLIVTVSVEAILAFKRSKTKS